LSDYFAFLGLQRKLQIDMNDLERRYRALSRQFHPDYFHNASPGERRVSLERSSYLNDAYRTLKNPVARVEYLLELEEPEPRDVLAAGSASAASGGEPPPQLLEDVFALNEELDEIRRMRDEGAARGEWHARLDRAREPIEARRVEHQGRLAELSTEWDRAIDSEAPADRRRAILAAIRERLLEQNYISNLLAGIERISDEQRGTSNEERAARNE
jgi:molecular chaperone HscB